MMKRTVQLSLVIVLLSTSVAARYTLPGKPALTSCRSPEKETFTCWWKPSDDGGLPTKYALYYRKENSDKVYECPDYSTAGEFSCFFNKKDTSIWINYNITVVATNALGSTFSDPVDIDVVYIVQPNPPEKVSSSIMEDKSWPFLRVSWEPPQKADTRSGWITLMYEIRIKLEDETDWEMHSAGQQKTFNIFSLRSGGKYLVQVRCKPDHGFWSEWSAAYSVSFPEYAQRERSMWILIIIFSAFIFFIFTCFLHINSNSLKDFFLPPVPGPKIKGFDKHLLKDGDSDFSALVICDFPPTTLSSYDELVVEYLEVFLPEEQESMLDDRKHLRGGLVKSDDLASDSDSGHGSCDSHTLLMDKCEKTKTEINRDEGIRGRETEKDWEENDFSNDGADSPDMSSGRVKTWPSVFAPFQKSSAMELSGQNFFSDSLLQPSSSIPTLVCQSTQEGREYWEFCSKPAQTLHQTWSDADISRIRHKDLPAEPYVEVQRVNDRNMVLLQPVEQDRQCPLEAAEKDYSKVKRVDGGDVLLLQTHLKDVSSSPDETSEKGLTASGYVDTATLFQPLHL